MWRRSRQKGKLAPHGCKMLGSVLVLCSGGFFLAACLLASFVITPPSADRQAPAMALFTSSSATSERPYAIRFAETPHTSPCPLSQDQRPVILPVMKRGDL